MKYICPLLVVADISASRDFYERILEQKVKFDFGQNVTFEGDFAIHLKEHYQGLLGHGSKYPIAHKSNNFELYFETENIDSVYAVLKQHAVQFIHEIQAQPWGQQVMRFYDPDGHIVEVGETMEAVVLRFYQQGLNVEQVCQKSAMPKEFVESVIGFK